MVRQLSWKVGGQQGEGIESTGAIFARTLVRLGYHLYGYRHFSSRIKGGHTNNHIRISTTPVQTVGDAVDILVAFDQEAIDFCHGELRPEAIVIAESAIEPVLPTGSSATLCPLPLTEVAGELGSPLMKNMVAVGASLVLLGIEVERCYPVLRAILGKKGEKVVEANLAAARQGGELLRSRLETLPTKFNLAPGDGVERLYLIGNEAVAFGALAGGCRFMAAYPITPSSEIMEYLIRKLPLVGGAVIQTEDEIAACTMAIGASHAGVRALTASSGPGLSLMAEAIGLAGMTETPLVVVDTQRGGPSTGLPTKQEQSDLLAMIHGTHGEIPKIVLAPSSAEEAFYLTAEALNLAEEYQCPVILLSDAQLALAEQTVSAFDQERITIRRGRYEVDPVLPEQSDPVPCRRYEITPDGISPRLRPGVKNGIIHTTGLEHDENGRPAEGAANHCAQMDKRLRKLESLRFPEPVLADRRHETPDLLLVGFNSTRGAIAEARERLEADGLRVNLAHLRLLHPFPTAELAPLVAAAGQVWVIEQNATGQLAQLLRLHLAPGERLRSLCKYDGTPFLVRDIHQAIVKEAAHGNG